MKSREIGAKRQRLGAATVSIIYAITRLDRTRATVSTLWLMAVNEGAWSISALSEALSIDRSTIRSTLRALEEEGCAKQGWSLTPKGQFAAWCTFKQFWSYLDRDMRQTLKTFGQTTYKQPVKQFMRVFCDLDRVVRTLRHTLSQSAVADVLIYLPKPDGWTISEISDYSGVAYQTVHRELNVLKASGYAAQEGKRFTITRKGLFWDFGRFLNVLKHLSRNSYLTAARFAVWQVSTAE